MDKQGIEITGAGTIGFLGLTIPNLDATAEFFAGVTPIVSFFLIVIPTGIWAWLRAIQWIMKTIKGNDDGV